MNRVIIGLVLGLSGVLASVAVASDHLDSDWVAADQAIDIADLYLWQAAEGFMVGALTLTGAPEVGTRYAIHFDQDPSDDVGGLTIDYTIGIRLTPSELGGAPCLNVQVGAFESSSCEVEGAFDVETESYEFVVDLGSVLGEGAGLAVYGGWCDDPFFFDQISFFDMMATLTNWTGGICLGDGCNLLDLTDVEGEPGEWGVTHLREDRVGSDSYAGNAIYAIVLEFPSALLSESPLFSVWSASYRRTARIRTAQGDVERGPWIQMDRMAMPFLTLGLITDPQARNLYNRSPITEGNEVTLTALVSGVRLLLVAALTAFNDEELDPPTVSVSIDDLIDRLNPDVIDVNLLDEETPFPQFPNGRSPEADVMDIMLTDIMGVPMTDDVPENDCEFLEAFPYLASADCHVD